MLYVYYDKEIQKFTFRTKKTGEYVKDKKGNMYRLYSSYEPTEWRHFADDMLTDGCTVADIAEQLKKYFYTTANKVSAFTKERNDKSREDIAKCCGLNSFMEE